MSLNRDPENISTYSAFVFVCGGQIGLNVFVLIECVFCGESFVKATTQKSFSSLASCLGEGSNLNLFFFLLVSLSHCESYANSSVVLTAVETVTRKLAESIRV